MASKHTVLFLCTGNSCRSQMAEAILRHLGGERFVALSAGSHPAGYVHPLAVSATEALNIPLEDQVSESWDEYAETPIDLVITLCDAAAAEICPVWTGNPVSVHWSMPDPSFHPGSDEDRLAFAVLVAERLRSKIEGLIALDWSAEKDELKRRLQFLGEI